MGTQVTVDPRAIAPGAVVIQKGGEDVGPGVRRLYAFSYGLAAQTQEVQRLQNFIVGEWSNFKYYESPKRSLLARCWWRVLDGWDRVRDAFLVLIGRRDVDYE